MGSSSGSATTGASRAAAWALGCLAALGCPRVEVGSLPPEATAAEPAIRVGLSFGVAELTVGGGNRLLVGGDGGGLLEVPSGTVATLVGDGSLVEARLGRVRSRPAPILTVRPGDSSGFVRINGRDYRGDLVVSPTPTGLLAVNLLSVEAYVAGVVNAEMGRRPPGDSAAVFAQAVISRTVAVRALGRYRVRGYDLVSTIADQAYGGVATETDLAWAAVRATRGEIVTFNGAVIEAFFHSTCGGRTEAVDQVFGGAAQPYLRSVSDRSPTGEAYCALSPRFRWREEWTGESLIRTLRENRAVASLSLTTASGPADLRVEARSPSGRASELTLTGAGGTAAISGQQVIRQLLRLPDGGWLRSAQFVLQVTRGGNRIVRLVADGGGNGHGVGMCQWGAVGRARAGFSYREILAAYFPGTEVRRLF